MITYDPSEYIRGLQQILVSDKKRIGFLFGAGTSLAKKNKNSLQVPAIGVMTEEICSALNANSDYENAISEIKIEIEDRKNKFNIETLLSNIEQKVKIIGNGTLNNLTKKQFEILLREIKVQIKNKVSIHKEILKDDNIENLIHSDFAEWIGKTDRNSPIEIFTTNYDYLFELGLEDQKIPFYDGFTGSYQPFFDSGSIENLRFIQNQTKLWKIHGSLGWHYNNKTNQVWRKDSDEFDILIYPSALKYDESKKQPYTALMDRLSKFLKEPDTVLIINGYSFSDDHINERILTALNSNTTAHVLVLYYDISWNEGKKSYLLTEDSNLSKIAKSNGKLSIFGCRTAIIGGQFGKWKLKREPDKSDAISIDSYFDSDAPVDSKLTVGDSEKTGEEIWTGEGELILPRFEKFVNFLQSMIVENDIFVSKI